MALRTSPMVRTARHRVNPRVALAATAVLAAAVGLAPSRYTAWTGWVGDIAEFLVAPAQHPMAWVVRRMQGPPGEGRADDPRTEHLTREIELLRTQNVRLRQDVEQLERQLTDLQLGVRLNPDLLVRQLTAPVIGGASDLSSGLLKVLAGRRDGAEYNSVAVVGGVHLVGRVVEASARFCRVLPITDPRAGHLQGVVMLTDDREGPLCDLAAQGDGALVGPVANFAGDPAEEPAIERGMRVRLSDNAWPRHAQSLVIGRIEEVRIAENRRRIVTVRPEFRVERVSEVVLRTLGERDGRGSGEGGGP